MESSFKGKLLDLNSRKSIRNSSNHLKSRFSKNSLKMNKKNTKREQERKFSEFQLDSVIELREYMILQ